MPNSSFVEIDFFQKKKYNQNAYGDTFLSERNQDEGRLVAVLSDGLGSGIKANILSQMTASMLLKFMNAGRDLLKASETIMNSLPVCQVRQISYATFSAIDCSDDGYLRVVEEGNPQFLWFRGDESLEVKPTKVITSAKFENRSLNIYELKLEPEDRIVLCSDGVTQAGLGSAELKLGLRRKGLSQFVKAKLKQNPNISSRALSRQIVNMAEKIEPDNNAKDDISAVVLYFRDPRKMMVFTGPPYYSDRDNEYAQLFASYEGKRVICGGTTANLISRELNRPITTKMLVSENLPTVSTMEGVDLVTEGILTLTKAHEYLEDIDNLKKDSAGMLVDMFLDSDCIDFMVGAKVNQAHYDPQLPIELEIRKNIVKRMIKTLEEKYMKKITLQFI